MGNAEEVDTRLVEAFNAACLMARDGRNEDALKGYRRVLEDAKRPRIAASKEFLTTARMRAGFCLMDLARYEEARVELQEAMRGEESLSPEGRYELAFAYGNTLGSLGRMDECFLALIDALCLAEDMDDFTVRPAMCWQNILDHAVRAKAWKFLAAKAEVALHAARVRGMGSIERLARERIQLARRERAS